MEKEFFFAIFARPKGAGVRSRSKSQGQVLFSSLSAPRSLKVGSWQGAE